MPEAKLLKYVFKLITEFKKINSNITYSRWTRHRYEIFVLSTPHHFEEIFFIKMMNILLIFHHF